MQRSGGWRRVLAAAGLVVVAGAGTAAPAAAASPPAYDPGVFGSGNNDYGQIGHGTDVDDQGLGHVVGLPAEVRQIAAGGNTSAALLPDGTVWLWGAALDGMSSGIVPARVAGLTGITQIAVSQNGGDLFAVGPGGSVWALGRNTGGQLGNGSTADDFSAAPVPGLTGITQVSAGAYDTVAVGDGTTATRFSPEPLSLSAVTQIAVGTAASAAVRSDGTLLTWGDNSSGGLDTSACCRLPVNPVPAPAMSQRPAAGSYAPRGTHVPITIGKPNPRLCS